MILLLLFLPLWINSEPYLSWVNDTQTTITVSWQTALAESSVLEYGLDTTNTDTIVNLALDTVHSLEITNLTPSSKYYYRVRLNDKFYSFKTAAVNCSSFTFCVFGDTRSDSASHQGVVDRIIAIQPDFTLHMGDCVYYGSSESEWSTFFNTEKNLISSTPFMPTAGNHESPFTTYFDLFHLPGNEKWYSFNYGNSHFVCLDTEDSLVGTQRIWLDNDLLSANINPDINWIFVYFHRPPYSKSIDGWTGDTAIISAWCDLFEKYGVNLVFSGHNHFYQRTNIINNVIYIISGGGGGPLYEPDTASWIVCSKKAYHCCKLEVSGFFLRMNAIASDGTVIDSFAIKSSCEENNSTSKFFVCLSQNYPNPFVRFTNIKYYVPVKSKTSLQIYNNTGKLLKTLVDEEKDPGAYNVDFDAKGFISGIYFVRLTIGKYKEIKKISLIK